MCQFGLPLVHVIWKMEQWRLREEIQKQRKPRNLNEITTEIPKLLEDIQNNIYQKALKFRDGHDHGSKFF